MASVGSEPTNGRPGAISLGNASIDQAGLERIVAEMSDVFLIVDNDWRFAYVDDRAAVSAGTPAADLLGRVIWDAFPSYLGTEIEGVLRRAMAERAPAECEMPVPTSDRWLSARVLPHVDGLYVYGRDVTDRKSAEENLRRHIERYRALDEEGPDPIAEFDAQFRYLRVNRAMADLMGILAEEFIGKTPAEIGVPESGYAEWRRAAGQVFETREPGRAEIVWDTPEAKRYYDTRILPLFAADGTVSSILSMPRDITGLRRAEETAEARARQQEAVARLGQRILHEVPLASLIDEALALVAEMLGVEFASFLELEPDGRDLVLRAGIGWPSDELGRVRVPVGTASAAGYVIHTRAPLVVHDLLAESRFANPPHLFQHRARSLVDVLVEEAGRPLGVFGAVSRHPFRFTEDDVSFVQAVANTLAVVIDRERREEVIRRLSTPVLTVREHLLLLPLIGAIDGRRARQLTSQLLHAIRAERARAVVIDLTGVADMERTVADRLVQAIEAARLLGAQALVTGISASTSRALVDVGVDLTRLRTFADLQGGLEEAERVLQRGARLQAAPAG